MSTIPRILPIFRGPEPVIDWDTVDDPVGKMKEHLQTAVTLELYTTPLYLFALYSVNGSDSARGAIASQSLNNPLRLLFNSLMATL